MRILLLNQTFHPDVVSTAQYLTDVAVELAAEGHDVTVLTGSSGYDNSALRFPLFEVWKGIRIVRLRSIRLAKDARWKRAVDFGSYMVNCSWRLATLGRFDVIIALTSPPLISVLGAAAVRLRGGRSVFWVMDLNPDEAIAAGWLRADSIPARILGRLLRFSCEHADAVIVLDQFMRDRLIAKGISKSKIVVSQLWPHEEDVTFDEAARDEFRREHKLENSFVVMYAGNHSPCNPLTTLFEAASRLREHPHIRFCFVGGGSEVKAVKRVVEERGLTNILSLNYQPRARLSGVLSAADLHAVTFGNAFVGILHPCKIYNILRVGSAVLYIGPAESHIVAIGATLAEPSQLSALRHGDVEGTVSAITEAYRRWRESNSRRFAVPVGIDKRRALEGFVDAALGSPARARFVEPALGSATPAGD